MKKHYNLAGCAKGVYEEEYINKLRESENYIQQLEEAVDILEKLKTDHNFIQHLRNTINIMKELNKISINYNKP